MFEIDGVFHDIYFLFCSWIQIVDSTPLPVHTPTLRKKGCPGSTGFPAKVLNLDLSMMCSEKKMQIMDFFCFLHLLCFLLLVSSKLQTQKLGKKILYDWKSPPLRKEECHKVCFFFHLFSIFLIILI